MPEPLMDALVMLLPVCSLGGSGFAPCISTWRRGMGLAVGVCGMLKVVLALSLSPGDRGEPQPLALVIKHRRLSLVGDGPHRRELCSCPLSSLKALALSRSGDSRGRLSPRWESVL